MPHVKYQPPDIPGADSVVEWFGHWPSFHDAEVLELELRRSGVSHLRIHAWNTSNETYLEDGKEYCVLEKHAIVTFDFEGLVGLDLGEFNEQNVLGSPYVDRQDGVFCITLAPCWGLNGLIKASRLRVSISPGKPDDKAPA